MSIFPNLEITLKLKSSQIADETTRASMSVFFSCIAHMSYVARSSGIITMCIPKCDCDSQVHVGMETAALVSITNPRLRLPFCWRIFIKTPRLH